MTARASGARSGLTGRTSCKDDHQEAVKRGELLPMAESLAVEEAREVRAELRSRSRPGRSLGSLARLLTIPGLLVPGP